MSQEFKDTPDINPIKIDIFFNEQMIERETPITGFLVSPHIGPKVFLNIFTEHFGYPPTKVLLFKAEIIDADTREVQVIEIPTKQGSTKRLFQYGVTSSSKLFIFTHLETDKKFT